MRDLLGVPCPCLMELFKVFFFKKIPQNLTSSRGGMRARTQPLGTRPAGKDEAGR